MGGVTFKFRVHRTKETIAMDKQYKVAKEFVDNQGRRWKVGQAYKANKEQIDAALAAENIEEGQGTAEGSVGAQTTQDQGTAQTQGQSRKA